MVAKKSAKKKIYVLDTSVILHDNRAVVSFEENDVAIPITVLEELDNFKKGNDSKNYEAREFIRFVDQIAGSHTLQEWIPLTPQGGRLAIIMEHGELNTDAQKILGNKADHKILNAAIHLAETQKGKSVILVTKDINLRLKAKALNIQSEDFEAGKVQVGPDTYTGRSHIDDVPADIIRRIYTDGYTEEVSVLGQEPVNNHFYILKNGKSSILSFYNAMEKRLERVEKQYTFGIKPKNAEQTFALNAIMNPEVKLLTIQGVAGTGKTLLALAGALEQHKKFKQIILARPIVPLNNKDIGYLPGDAREKINPYMEPLWDNLKFIKGQFGEGERKYKLIDDMLKDERIVVTPLAYIRGRSFSDIMFIVDEAQNLTPLEIKTIITRAGENTKIIFTGDVRQIDTPYLDDQSNGLAYVIDRLKGNSIYAHITLEKGERSELANLANELL